MSRFASRPLGDLCEIDRRVAGAEELSVARLPFVGLANIGASTGTLNLDAKGRTGDRKGAAFLFDNRHVLYGKLAPYLNKVATPEFAGCCSTEIVPILPREDVDRDFLAHLLRRKETVDFVVASVTGTRMPRADMKILMSMGVPYPSLREQRLISGALNRVVRIENLYANANCHVCEIVPRLFIGIFGDPAENPKGWPVRDFSEVVEDSTRKAKKIKKIDYGERGGTQIIDQGKLKIAGYTDETEGVYNGPLPAVIFGDHTRCFKLVRDPFFLGADGAKLLVPRVSDVDPGFLYGQFLCLRIEDAGYSRHFKFLKDTKIMIPPVERQKRFGKALERLEQIESRLKQAGEIASNLRASLMAHLLEQSP